MSVLRESLSLTFFIVNRHDIWAHIRCDSILFKKFKNFMALLTIYVE